ncbi:MAG TPA: S-methyl-5-thioribose-1-phosphate isomerase [Chloroflexia bacterium]|nr:S-methyl-5-thioribose-1-phosphate isomerase [Chloroflexia bacterium]
MTISPVEAVKPNNEAQPLQPVQWLKGGTVRLIDQTLLPGRVEYVDCGSVEKLADSIRTLKVRGAPAIGIAAAYGLYLAAVNSRASDVPALVADLHTAANTLRATRPTAVNLAWALDEVLRAADRAADWSGEYMDVRAAVLAAAERIDSDNSEANLRMGEHGAALLHSGMNVLTHCNAGPLAAGGIGSALGIIYTAHNEGKALHVWVDETRPILQGARLTTWELGQWGIPYTLLADSMAASLMSAGRVDAVLVGADRIAANGDTANKIGTYGLAVLANYHSIPFYVAAPRSTLDPSLPDGTHIKIEQRAPEEVTHHGGVLFAPPGAPVYNPAFDVTPGKLISAIITESGVMRPPFAISDW